MHSDGITLTNNNRSWVSVANPLRTDTISEHTLAYAPPLMGLLQGLIPVICGGVISLATILVGGHLLLAIALGVAVLILVLAVQIRRSNTQQEKRRDSLIAQSEGLGPRRIARGSFLPGPHATAADGVVMETTRILKSKAFRSESLGPTHDVYTDLLKITWDLLRKLQILEEETRKVKKLLRQVDDEDRDLVESLNSAIERAWAQNIEPAVFAHRELADAVDELDLVLDNSGDPVSADDVDVRASRATAALEMARRRLDHPPGHLPKLAEHSSNTPTHIARTQLDDGS